MNFFHNAVLFDKVGCTTTSLTRIQLTLFLLIFLCYLSKVMDFRCDGMHDQTHMLTCKYKIKKQPLAFTQNVTHVKHKMSMHVHA